MDRPHSIGLDRADESEARHAERRVVWRQVSAEEAENLLVRFDSRKPCQCPGRHGDRRIATEFDLGAESDPVREGVRSASSRHISASSRYSSDDERVCIVSSPDESH
jgi:hypothetical protein